MNEREVLIIFLALAITVAVNSLSIIVIAHKLL